MGKSTAQIEAELDKKLAKAQDKAKSVKAKSTAEIEAELDAKLNKAEKPGGVMGLLGKVGQILSTPQQAAFKTVKGVRKIATGDVSGGLSSIARAGGEITDLAGLTDNAGGDDIEFTETIGAKKLPKFVEGTAQVVADPLNFVTFGAGTVAKSATKTVAKEAGEQLAEKLATGGLKSLSAAEKATVREALEKGASAAKNPTKTAEKQIKQLAKRARGGVTVHVPGTKLAATPVSKASADKISKTLGIKAAKSAVKGSKPAQFLGDALVPGVEMTRNFGKKLSDTVLARESARASRVSGDISDLTLRLRSALDDFEDAAGRKFDVDDDTFVHNALESGDLDAAVAARPDLGRVITSFDKVRKATTSEQVRAGVLDAMHDSKTYLRRIRTPEADEALGREAQKITDATPSASSALRQKANKRRSVAPESTAREVNDAIAAIQRGEEIAPGSLRDPKTVGEFQAASKRRLAKIEEEADEIRSRHLEPAAGELSEKARLRLAKLEGEAAVHKSIARKLKKQNLTKAAEAKAARAAARAEGVAAEELPPLYAKKGTVRAEKRAANAAGKVDATEDRLRHEAAQKLWRNDEKRLQIIDEQKQRAVSAIEAAGQRGQAHVENVVREIAQQLPPGTKLYEESAVQSLLKRGIESAKAVSTADMVSEIRALADDEGMPVLLSADDLAVLGAKAPAGWVSFDLPHLGTFHAPAAMRDELTKFMGIIGQDSAVEGFHKFLRGANKWWKTMVTVYPASPAFTLRNARSNAFLTFADGMAPHWFGRGLAFQRKVASIKKNFAADIADHGVDAVLRRELPAREFDLYKNAVDEGVIGAGYFDIDIQGAPKIKVRGAPKDGNLAKRTLRNVAGSEGAAADAGRRFNQAVEQNARLSHYLYSVERLGNLKAAAERTNTVLFDYGRATAFEAKVIKKVLPFWTFMSRVVPGQFRAIVENPARIVVPEKLSRLTTKPLDENAPEYQRRGGGRVATFGPFAGMVTMPERPLQAAIKTLEPLSQAAAAVLPGKQGALEPEHGLGQAGRSLLAQMGGVPGSQLKALAEESGNVDLFTGFRLADNEARQRFLVELFPPLGRLPRIAARELPGSVVEARRKLPQPLLSDIAQVLGFKVEPAKKDD